MYPKIEDVPNNYKTFTEKKQKLKNKMKIATP